MSVKFDIQGTELELDRIIYIGDEMLVVRLPCQKPHEAALFNRNGREVVIRNLTSLGYRVRSLVPSTYMSLAYIELEVDYGSEERTEASEAGVRTEPGGS